VIDVAQEMVVIETLTQVCRYPHAHGTVFTKGSITCLPVQPKVRVGSHELGHAISADMVHWQNLPVALHEEPGQYMVTRGARWLTRQHQRPVQESDPQDPHA